MSDKDRPVSPAIRDKSRLKYIKSKYKYIGCSCKYIRSNYKYVGFSCKYIRSNCKFIKCTCIYKLYV